MRLNVVTMNGLCAELDPVDPLATVGALKLQATAALFDGGADRSLSSYRLVHKGNVLHGDAMSLAKFAISNNATLTLVTVAATTLAAGGLDGSVRLLNSATQEEHIWRCDGPILNLAFSSTGSKLAVAIGEADRNGQVVVFDADSKNPEASFKSLEGSAVAMAWAPDGKQLATTDAAIVRILEMDVDSRHARSLDTGQKQIGSIRLAGANGCAAATSMAWSCQSHLAVSTGSYGACGGISVLCIDTGQVLWVWDAWRAVRCIRWNSDGSVLAAAIGSNLQGDPGSVVILANGQAQNCWHVNSPANGLSWNPDGNRVAVATGHFRGAVGMIHLFSLESGKETGVCENISCSSRSVDWSPDGEQLAVATDDGGIQILSSRTGDEHARWDFPTMMQAVTWAPELLN